MTRDDIVRMAQEAGLIDFRDAYSAEHVSVLVDSLEPFAALVAAAEREACAKVCEDEARLRTEDEKTHIYGSESQGRCIAAARAALNCEAAIRARGEAA